MPHGDLEVYLEGALNIKDTSFLGKGSPYCILTVGDQVQKSKVVAEGGTKPYWDQTFTFKIDRSTIDLKIEVKSKSKLRDDDLLGDTILKFLDVFYEGHQRPIIPYKVIRSGRHHGDIRLGLKFYAKRRPQSLQPQPPSARDTMSSRPVVDSKPQPLYNPQGFVTDSPRSVSSKSLKRFVSFQKDDLYPSSDEGSGYGYSSHERHGSTGSRFSEPIEGFDHEYVETADQYQPHSTQSGSRSRAQPNLYGPSHEHPLHESRSLPPLVKHGQYQLHEMRSLPSHVAPSQPPQQLITQGGNLGRVMRNPTLAPHDTPVWPPRSRQVEPQFGDEGIEDHSEGSSSQLRHAHNLGHTSRPAHIVGSHVGSTKHSSSPYNGDGIPKAPVSHRSAPPSNHIMSSNVDCSFAEIPSPSNNDDGQEIPIVVKVVNLAPSPRYIGSVEGQPHTSDLAKMGVQVSEPEGPLWKSVNFRQISTKPSHVGSTSTPLAPMSEHDSDVESQSSHHSKRSNLSQDSKLSRISKRSEKSDKNDPSKSIEAPTPSGFRSTKASIVSSNHGEGEGVHYNLQPTIDAPHVSQRDLGGGRVGPHPLHFEQQVQPPSRSPHEHAGQGSSDLVLGVSHQGPLHRRPINMPTSMMSRPTGSLGSFVNKSLPSERPTMPYPRGPMLRAQVLGGAPSRPMIHYRGPPPYQHGIPTQPLIRPMLGMRPQMHHQPPDGHPQHLGPKFRSSMQPMLKPSSSNEPRPTLIEVSFHDGETQSLHPSIECNNEEEMLVPQYGRDVTTQPGLAQLHSENEPGSQDPQGLLGSDAESEDSKVSKNSTVSRGSMKSGTSNMSSIHAFPPRPLQPKFQLEPNHSRAANEPEGLISDLISSTQNFRPEENAKEVDHTSLSSNVDVDMEGKECDEQESKSSVSQSVMVEQTIEQIVIVEHNVPINQSTFIEHNMSMEQSYSIEVEVEHAEVQVVEVSSKQVDVAEDTNSTPQSHLVEANINCEAHEVVDVKSGSEVFVETDAQLEYEEIQTTISAATNVHVEQTYSSEVNLECDVGAVSHEKIDQIEENIIVEENDITRQGYSKVVDVDNESCEISLIEVESHVDSFETNFVEVSNGGQYDAQQCIKNEERIVEEHFTFTDETQHDLGYEKETKGILNEESYGVEVTYECEEQVTVEEEVHCTEDVIVTGQIVHMETITTEECQVDQVGQVYEADESNVFTFSIAYENKSQDGVQNNQGQDREYHASQHNGYKEDSNDKHATPSDCSGGSHDVSTHDDVESRSSVSSRSSGKISSKKHVKKKKKNKEKVCFQQPCTLGEEDNDLSPPKYISKRHNYPSYQSGSALPQVLAPTSADEQRNDRVNNWLHDSQSTTPPLHVDNPPYYRDKQMAVIPAHEVAHECYNPSVKSENKASAKFKGFMKTFSSKATSFGKATMPMLKPVAQAFTAEVVKEVRKDAAIGRQQPDGSLELLDVFVKTAEHMVVEASTHPQAPYGGGRGGQWPSPTSVIAHDRGRGMAPNIRGIHPGRGIPPIRGGVPPQGYMREGPRPPPRGPPQDGYMSGPPPMGGPSRGPPHMRPPPRGPPSMGGPPRGPYMGGPPRGPPSMGGPSRGPYMGGPPRGPPSMGGPPRGPYMGGPPRGPPSMRGPPRGPYMGGPPRGPLVETPVGFNEGNPPKPLNNPQVSY